MLFQRKTLSSRWQVTTETQCGILPRVADNSVRCTKSQAVHLEPVSFFAFVVARWVEEGALCLVALMTAIWKRSEQMMLASTGRTVLCQTLIAIMRQRAAKRVDRSGEDNDEISATLIFLSILGLEPQPIRASCCSRQNSNTLDHRLRLHHEPLPAVWRGPAGVAFL